MRKCVMPKSHYVEYFLDSDGLEKSFELLLRKLRTGGIDDITDSYINSLFNDDSSPSSDSTGHDTGSNPESNNDVNNGGCCENIGKITHPEIDTLFGNDSIFLPNNTGGDGTSINIITHPDIDTLFGKK